MQDWINAMKSDGEPCLNFDISVPLTEWVNLGNLSLFREGKLQWDSKNLEVTNRRSTNDDVTREYRDGWDPKQFA